MEQFPVAFTPEALERLQAQVRRKGLADKPLRVGVKGGGCSGLEYVLAPGATRAEGDLTGEVGGFTLLCDPKSAKFLHGTTVRWTGNLIGGGFAFDNPNAARSCGCGTSFTPKPSA